MMSSRRRERAGHRDDHRRRRRRRKPSAGCGHRGWQPQRSRTPTAPPARRSLSTAAAAPTSTVRIELRVERQRPAPGRSHECDTAASARRRPQHRAARRHRQRRRSQRACGGDGHRGRLAAGPGRNHRGRQPVGSRWRRVPGETVPFRGSATDPDGSVPSRPSAGSSTTWRSRPLMARRGDVAAGPGRQHSDPHGDRQGGITGSDTRQRHARRAQPDRRAAGADPEPAVDGQCHGGHLLPAAEGRSCHAVGGGAESPRRPATRSLPMPTTPQPSRKRSTRSAASRSRPSRRPRSTSR